MDILDEDLNRLDDSVSSSSKSSSTPSPSSKDSSKVKDGSRTSPRKKQKNNEEVEYHWTIRNSIPYPYQFQGQSFDVQSQQIIINVLHFFQWLKKEKMSLDSLMGPRNQTALALNINVSTITSILNRHKSGNLPKPKISEQRSSKFLNQITQEDEEYIMEIIKRLKEKQKLEPLVQDILTEFKAYKKDFKASKTTFRRLLNRIGYKRGYRKKQNSKKLKKVDQIVKKESKDPKEYIEESQQIPISQPSVPSYSIQTDFTQIEPLPISNEPMLEFNNPVSSDLLEHISPEAEDYIDPVDYFYLDSLQLQDLISGMEFTNQEISQAIEDVQQMTEENLNPI